MFIVITTKKNEKICLNIEHIVFITEIKNHAVIVDVLGTDYELGYSYEEFMSEFMDRFINT